MLHPPPPPHWLWFAAVAGLAVLASLTIASGHDPPVLAMHGLSAAPADVAASGALPRLDPSPMFDRQCRVCEHLPN